MEIAQLRTVRLLLSSGKMELSEFSAFIQLQMNSNDASLSDPEFAQVLRTVGPDAARELWRFLGSLPDKAMTRGNFHFATGMTDPSMAPVGSLAAQALTRWSEIMSEAIDLVGHDFEESAEQARGTFQRMEHLLDDENDRLITSKLKFFEVRNDEARPQF